MARRILVVGSSGSPVLDIVKDLTGTAPPLNSAGSAAGVTHEWDVKTAYYTAKVPIWIDEITAIAQWRDEFLQPEAGEVVQAIGAYIYCFRAPQNGEVDAEMEGVMQAIEAISEEHAGYGADTVMLAVAMPPTKGLKQDVWDDTCMQYGFEFIDYGAKGTNEFGEKVGFERMKEALEANGWTTAADDEEDDFMGVDDLDFDAGDDIGGFGKDEAEMTAELYGLKAALAGSESFEPEVETPVGEQDQAKDVDSLEKMMGKLLAVKEKSADLPEAQRKRMAAKAVRDLMKGEPDV